MQQDYTNIADTLNNWIGQTIPENILDEDDFIIEEGMKLFENTMTNENINEEYKLIPLGNELYSKVSNEDYEILNKNKWYIRSNDGYVCRNHTIKGEIIKTEGYRKTKQRSILMHRIIMGIDNQKSTVRYVVDHINGDKLDNRRENLRIVTVAQNLWNVNHLSKKNNTGCRGVSKTKAGKYKALITANGKRVYLGTFQTLEDADLAYKNAKQTYHRI